MDTYDFDSIYWPTDATERPQIKINATNETNDYLYSTDQDRQDSRTPTKQFLIPGAIPVDARWASGDSSGNPKIVSSFQNSNDAPSVRGFSGSAQKMQPLNLEIDPNAWELKNYDLQQLLGNGREYWKAIKFSCEWKNDSGFSASCDFFIVIHDHFFHDFVENLNQKRW